MPKQFPTPNSTNYLFERSDLLLALSLSAPARATPKEHGFTVEFGRDEVLVRTPYPKAQSSRSTRILCSKETIAFAILLHDYWLDHGRGEVESRIMNAVVDSAASHAHQDSLLSQQFLIFSREMQHPMQRSLSILRKSLDLPDDFMAKCNSHCRSVFETLEQEGLAIDPGFTPELVALCGMIPMQFSVRTERGEQVYRRIQVNAPLWNLNVDRVRRRGQNEYDWAFTFRGVNFVRGAILNLARQYLASEASQRNQNGLPTMQPPTDVHLDDAEGE